MFNLFFCNFAEGSYLLIVYGVNQKFATCYQYCLGLILLPWKQIYLLSCNAAIFPEIQKEPRYALNSLSRKIKFLNIIDTSSFSLAKKIIKFSKCFNIINNWAPIFDNFFWGRNFGAEMYWLVTFVSLPLIFAPGKLRCQSSYQVVWKVRRGLWSYLLFLK